jgi:uncharacterized RDD family membrane protein YckC
MFFIMGIPSLFLRYAEVQRGPGLWAWVPEFIAGLYLVAMMFGMEAWKGTTPAKFAFNLRVVQNDGLRARTGPVLLRFLLRYPVVILMLIPPEIPRLTAVISLLQTVVVGAALLCFFFFKRRTLSDLLTRTRVIYVGSGKPVMPFRRRAA